MNKFVTAAKELVKNGDDFLSHHGPLAFHHEAHELLRKANLPDLFDFKDLVQSSFAKDFNPNQNYASAQFSDLPITIAMGEHCFLDVYFWRRRPTVIHDHHFTGAFQCLEGANVDLEFEFIKSKKLGEFHDLGELSLKQSRSLAKGDIARIDLLDKFIHQNHHQAELTINACFRTPDIGATNLSNYLYSGLRFEKQPDLLNRTERLMGFLYIEDFDIFGLNLTLDDALHFLIRNYRSTSSSKRFMEMKEFMQEKVEQELGLDLTQLLDEHELKMDQIENQYN